MILHSYHPGFPWTDSIDRGIRTTLNSDREQLQLFTEYLDSKRSPPKKQFPRFARYLAEKYHGQRFSVIITSDDNALSFALRYREQLFPDAPIVFCGVNNLGSRHLEKESAITGVAEEVDILGTLRLALKLFPDTETIALVSDSTPTGRIMLRRALKIRDKLPDSIRFHMLSELTAEELQEGLRNLPRQSIVLNLSFWRDRHQRTFNREQSLRFLNENYRGPIFAIWDFTVGYGTLGGLVVDGYRQGQHAARLALQILAGAAPETLAIERESPNTPLFDDRALRRFGIDPDRLPRDAIIRNRPQSFYQRHKTAIWAGAGTVLLQSLVLLLLIANILRRRLAEKKLATSEANFRQLIEDSPNPIRVTRLGGNIDFVNRRFTEVFGYTRDDLPNMDAWFDKAYPDDDDRKRVRHFWNSQIEQSSSFGNPVEMQEWKVRCKNGDIRDIEFNHSQLGELGVSIMFDVTRRNRAEQERRALEQKILQAQKLESLGILAGGIAHDFNNLLMGILGCADLTLGKLPPESPVRDMVKMIVKSAERAADLTSQMLAYSGKGRFVVETINLNELVEEMAHLLQTVISKTALLRLNLAQVPVLTEADPTQLRQVIMNLITNASDAIGKRSGVISITTGVMDADAEYLAGSYLDDNLQPGPFTFVEVSDSGAGMGEETRRRIFDPFFTTKFAGRGLGLAAVLGIVRSHHGAIRIYSEPGKGTSFKILLPCCTSAVRHPETSRAATLPTDLAERCGAILIVDDDETVRSVGRMMLEEYGFKVHLAEDGREGVDLLRRNPDRIGLVLLDLTMPHIDGEEAFRQMRTIKPDIRVILSSGYNEQDATDLMAGKGLAGFLHKPYRSEDLLTKVIETLQI
ncbi:ABC transporter substrate binding protein [Geothermobacter hydrogeniphilus]|nr:ABC transporter substrate binding protein [Geothermobacter hydrogeniphilus]